MLGHGEICEICLDTLGYDGTCWNMVGHADEICAICKTCRNMMGYSGVS